MPRRSTPLISVRIVGLTSIVGTLILALIFSLEQVTDFPLSSLIEVQLVESSSPLPSLEPSPSPSQTPTESAILVTQVIDGDTIKLANGETVRYIGIDAPEVRPSDCYQQQATAKNQELVENQYVTLESDVRDRDRYGRLLRYVYIDEKMVNEILVAEGYALATSYPPDIKYQERLQAAQTIAQSNNLGLWSACEINR